MFEKPHSGAKFFLPRWPGELWLSGFSLFVIISRCSTANAFDHHLHKIPDRRFQPLIIENAHVQRLIPLLHGHIAHTRAILHTLAGNDGNAHTGLYQIQRRLRCIYRADDVFICQRAAGPLLEALFNIMVDRDLGHTGQIRRLSILMKTQTGGDFTFTEKLVKVVAIIRLDISEYTAKCRPLPKARPMTEETPSGEDA